MIWYLIVTVISMFTVLPLVAQGYFPMHDDLQVMRLFELAKCFGDGQIPCRWVPDMGFGFGQPMFNFYSATPYYLGHLVRLLTPLTIIGTVKLLFALTLIVSAIGMFMLAKEFFGKQGALLSSVLYVFAPYRAVDVYVRGALSESFSLMLLPFLWLSIYKLIKKPTYKLVAVTAVIIGAQIATHNVSTLMYFFFTAVWVVYWLVKEFSFKKIYALFVSGALGFGLAAFFIVPIIFERKFIQDQFFTQDYFYFAAHFVSLKQLFINRNFGYGPSIFGDQDTISFQIGWPHWMLVPIALGIAWFLRSKQKRERITLISLFAGLFVFSIFLTHLKSFPIWNNFPTLTFVQFPWRFLGPAAFFVSLTAGGLSYLPKIIKQYALIFTIILAFILNVGYFKPKMHFYQDTDQSKLSGEQFYIQQKSAILDYLPIYAKDAPKSLAPDEPVVLSGDAEAKNYSKTSSTFFFDIQVNDPSVIQIPVMYYPGWHVYSLKGQGEEVAVNSYGDWGQMQIELQPGTYMIEGRFENTPLRAAANSITVVSFFVLLGGAIIVHNKKKFLGLEN